MAQNTTVTGGSGTTGSNDGLSEVNLIIIVVILAVVVVTLLVILACVIRNRRKRRETISKINSSTLETAHRSSNELQSDNLEDPNYAAYVDPTQHVSQTPPVSPDYSSDPPPPPPHAHNSPLLFTSNENNIYQNRPTGTSLPTLSTQGDYENFAERPKSLHPPEITPRRSAIVTPVRAKSPQVDVAFEPLPDNEAVKKRASKLFREGSRAYHCYMNAAHDNEVSRDCLIMKEKLGKGHFGNVYCARLYKSMADKKSGGTTNSRVVAVKTMKKTASPVDKNEFIYEYEIMKLVNTLSHPNLIKMIGSVTKSEPYMILLELMPNGNLREFLRGTRCNQVYYNLHGNSDSLTERQLLKFGLQIATGMEGIASLQLLHRDLAARNILLDKDLNCKIADFGFAKDVLHKAEYKSKSVFTRPRPTRWLPPESVIQYKHSIQSDVWSFGIVMWEIITLGNLPYPEIKDSSMVVTAIAKGFRMKCPRHCPDEIFDVISCCWEEYPKERPSFNQLVDKLQALHDRCGKMLDMQNMDDDDYIEDEHMPTPDSEIYSNFQENETLSE